jgi:hypothetical protein
MVDADYESVALVLDEVPEDVPVSFDLDSAGLGFAGLLDFPA